MVFSSANLQGSWNQTYKNVKYELNKVIGHVSPKWAAVCSLISGLVISNIVLYRSYFIMKQNLEYLSRGLTQTNNDVARELTEYARRTAALEDQMDHVKRALLNANIITSIR